MKKLLMAVLSAALLFTLASCASTDTGSSTASGDWTSLTEENAKQNYGKFYTSDELGKLSVLEAEFKKESGYEGSCFGFVFGYSEPKDGVLPNYLRFEINTLGEYAVYTWDGSKYTDILDETADNTAYLVENSGIKKGLGSTNKLKIETNANGEYTCYINGAKVASGITPMKNTSYGAMAFFSVGKADQENFPDAPVRISYRVTSSSAK